MALPARDDATKTEYTGELNTRDTQGTKAVNSQNLASSNPANGPLAPWLSWRRKRFWLLIALLSYTLLGFFAAPPLIKWVFVSNIEKTGRTASMEQVRVNPFLLTIQALNAEIRDADDTVILSYDEYFWNFQASSLFRWAWTFKEIRVVGLYLHEERFSGLDTRFTRLIESFSEQEETTDPPDDEPASLPRIIIGNFLLQDGRFSLRDQMAGGFESTFGPINVEVDDLRTLPDHRGVHSVSIRTAGDGHIEWRGSLEAVPFSSEGHLSLSGKGLDDAFRYADHFLPFQVFGDSAEIELDYHVGMRDDALFLEVDHLQAKLVGSGLRPNDSDTETLRIGTLDVIDGSLRWPESTARIERIAIAQAELRAGLLPDGSIDLLALVPELPEDETPAADTLPFVIEVGAIDIPAAKIHLSDGTMSPAVELSLDPLDLTIRQADNREGTSMPLELRTRLSTGGEVAYAGNMQVLPDVRTQGQLTLEGVQLAVAQAYIEPMVRVEIEDGVLGMSADLEHHPDQLARLEGSLRVERLLIHDNQQDERLLSWNTLALDRFEADLSANRLVTSTLEFEGLFGRFHIAEDLTTNVSDLLVEAPETDPEATPTELPEMQIGGIELANAGLDFSDLSLPLPFRTNIQQLNGEISTLSTSTSEPATVALEGQVNEFGQARIDGNLNPWAPTELANIDMTFRNLDLSRLTPYTVQFAGYAIDDGRIDLDLGYRLNQRKLQGDNNIVIRDIVLGEKSEHPDAGSLPLGLAIALLTDANGVIDLELPVEGDLDNPEFGISSVIWQALGNLITKAVTAPFRLLGSLVGIDSEDFGTLYFAAGRSDISPPDREQLLKLAEAMAQRPELTIEVGGVYDVSADTAALKALAVETLFEQRSAEMPAKAEELSTDHDQRVLEALAAELLPALDLALLKDEYTSVPEGSEQSVLDLPAYVAGLRSRLEDAQPVGAADLVALANARAESALAALRNSAPEAQLNAALAEPREVEGESARDIPLELSVSAGN
jgi:hypothetical protein